MPTVNEMAGKIARNSRDAVRMTKAAVRFRISQQGHRLSGTHFGDFVSRPLAGEIAGNEVEIESNYPESTGDSLIFNFLGRLEGERMSGLLDMRNYLRATWNAEREMAS
jgi:L-seryl-tRNA(Ser) seleniumtransferase